MRPLLSNDLPMLKINPMIYVFIYIFPVFLFVYFIYSMSSISNLSIPNLFVNQDKFFHLCTYTILSVLVFRSINYLNINMGWVYLLTILITTLYGVSDEIHQLFVPNRLFEYYDLLADFLGAILGVIIGRKWYNLDYHFIHYKLFKIKDVK